MLSYKVKSTSCLFSTNGILILLCWNFNHFPFFRTPMVQEFSALSLLFFQLKRLNYVIYYNITYPKMVSMWNQNWIRSYDNPLIVHKTTVSGDCTSSFAHNRNDCTLLIRLVSSHIDCCSSWCLYSQCDYGCVDYYYYYYSHDHPANEQMKFIIISYFIVFLRIQLTIQMK